MDWSDFNEQHARERIDHAVNDIRAATASEEVARKLGLERGEPVMVLHEYHYSDANAPLGYSQIWVNQEYVTFQVLRSK